MRFSESPGFVFVSLPPEITGSLMDNLTESHMTEVG